MADISSIVIPSGDSYDLKDVSAVASITKNDDTVTVTLRGGTSTSFDLPPEYTFTNGLTASDGTVSVDLLDSNLVDSFIDQLGIVSMAEPLAPSQAVDMINDIWEAAGDTPNYVDSIFGEVVDGAY